MPRGALVRDRDGDEVRLNDTVMLAFRVVSMTDEEGDGKVTLGLATDPNLWDDHIYVPANLIAVSHT